MLLKGRVKPFSHTVLWCKGRGDSPVHTALALSCVEGGEPPHHDALLANEIPALLSPAALHVS